MNILDNQRKNQILSSFELKKAYTEGVYADTPNNRKLGRVGMKYSSSSNEKNKEDKKLFHNELKLNESLSKISELEKQKLSFKDDKEVLNLLNKDIEEEKQKIEKICPNYEKSSKYVDKIFDTDEERGKRINVPRDCVESIKFLLRFEGLNSSEYKHEDINNIHYISLI